MITLQYLLHHCDQQSTRCTSLLIWTLYCRSKHSDHPIFLFLDHEWGKIINAMQYFFIYSIWFRRRYKLFYACHPQIKRGIVSVLVQNNVPCNPLRRINKYNTPFSKGQKSEPNKQAKGRNPLLSRRLVLVKVEETDCSKSLFHRSK